MAKKVKIATVVQALGLGFVPKDGNLVNPEGAEIPQGVLQSYGGRHYIAQMTGNTKFPAIVDGVIYPAALVIPKKGNAEDSEGNKYEVFVDGSLLSSTGETFEPGFIEFLAEPTLTRVTADARSSEEEEE